jgi:hypothetical protein
MNKKFMFGLMLFFALNNVTIISAQHSDVAHHEVTQSQGYLIKNQVITLGDIKSGGNFNVDFSPKNIWLKYRTYILLGSLIVLGLLLLQNRQENK